MNANYTPKDVKRFWKKVARTDNPDDCWNWIASFKDHKKYGSIGWNNTVERAHRVSWILANGEIPDGLHVLHTCDNPSCVNPKHLFLGTNTDNMRDRAAKGRYCNQPKGEQHKLHKLTDKQIVEILELFAQGGISKNKLALRYGVSRTHICRIVNDGFRKPK